MTNGNHDTNGNAERNEGREAHASREHDGNFRAGSWHGDSGAPPQDELDSLLRSWHDESAVTARARRDELLAKVALERTSGSSPLARHPGSLRDRLHRIGSAPALRAAAVMALAVVATGLMLLMPSRTASADITVAQVPEGGRLDAVDRDGNLIGPCPLQHTDVDAQISGFISRVTVTQKYANTYGRPIEAVYTFPLSHRAAVDRMRMIVRSRGEERVVEGEIKERSLARQIYEAARRDGFVTSLLEQERPNIFTQSVANIEPGAEVLVEISYVETLTMRDGVFTFDFPMVVGPRYIPGGPPSAPSMGGMPAGLVLRQGVILLAPAQVRLAEAPQPGSITASQVLASLQRAVAIEVPKAILASAATGVAADAIRARFSVKYPDGSEEPGTLLTDGTGEVAGRWFWCPPAPPEPPRDKSRGTGFAQGTNQVPDAGLITPMPVRPPERAGHDLSLRVSIDTGGPAVSGLRSELHKIDVSEPSSSRAVITLDKGKTIPNRDFALSWKLAGGEMAEGVLTQHVPGRDGYFLLYMVPPARVAPETIRPRELIFVLDTSGSMSGFPIEKSKEVMTRMLGTMRAGDTFNIITFAGDHHVLWPAPRPATEENLKLARAFVESRQGAGGTEMMKAIDAALKPSEGVRPMVRAEVDMRAKNLNSLPPSDTARTSPLPAVSPTRIVCFLTDGYVGNDMAIVDAVRKYAGTTRVFSFGIGNSVNRFLLAEMARAGRGAVDFVLLPSDADEVVTLFSERVRTPVLTDISVSFDGVETALVTPPTDSIPDLFDRESLVIAGRYPNPGKGSIRIRGMTGNGAWERTIPVDFSAGEGNSSVVAPIWARKQVDDILRPHLNDLQNGNVPPPIHDMVVRLAEQHAIMSPFTSFVAVEKARVTMGGRPVLVPVPIELPQGVSWEGNFGSAGEVLQKLHSPPIMADRDGDGMIEAGEVYYLGFESKSGADVHELASRLSEITAPMSEQSATAPTAPPVSAAAPASASPPAQDLSGLAKGAKENPAPKPAAPEATPPPPSAMPIAGATKAPSAAEVPIVVGKRDEADRGEMLVDKAERARVADETRRSVLRVAGSAPTEGFTGYMGGTSGGGGGGGAAPGGAIAPATGTAGKAPVNSFGRGAAATAAAPPTDGKPGAPGLRESRAYGKPTEGAPASNGDDFRRKIPNGDPGNRPSGSGMSMGARTPSPPPPPPMVPPPAPPGAAGAVGAAGAPGSIGGGSAAPGSGNAPSRLSSPTPPTSTEKSMGDKEAERGLKVPLDQALVRKEIKRELADSDTDGDRDRMHDSKTADAADPADAGRAPATEAAGSGANHRPFTSDELNRVSACLSESLFILGLEALAAMEREKSLAQAAPTTASEPMLVIARFKAVDRALLQKLADLGIKVEAKTSRAEVLVLRVPRERLIDLALVDGAIRVDPLEGENKAVAAASQEAPQP